ncbi:MAG: hypothetical protein BGO76_00270 [Caedibacter sp. 38-128]|nr:UDP-N-acetylmuramoyl-L-alanyl-D-glutamate--2,6-diaminopimelate ligase [Holosporales bacterium]OJX05020.1 MAG: hypothetical protein BGO76_00270 [Caedibacter sp. 38-128]
MRIQSLLHSESSKKTGEIDIVSIKLCSTNVKEGDLFVCLEEANHARRKEALERAIEYGASCILKSKRDDICVDFKAIPVIEVENVRQSLSELASNYYPHSIENIIGVTGTCGKTSTVSFIRQLLTLAGYKAASLGTEGVWIRDEDIKTIPKIITTPPTLHLHYILNYLTTQKISHLAMEVTSHGLSRHRVDHIPFKVGVFTNFSPSHLDYHKTMEHYYTSKKRFFSEVLLEGALSVINAQQEWSADILSVCHSRRMKTILIGKDIRLEKSNFTNNGTDIDLTFFGKRTQIHLPFLSTFQTENILFSIGASLGIGIDIHVIEKVIGNLYSPVGRMELVHTMSHGACIFIDNANRLETFEKTLKPLAESGKEIILVFGCGGGEYYKDRRKLLGEIAQKYANMIIVTDDNARDEDPSAIRKMILEGCPHALEIPDRGEAIFRALKSLKPNNICIIAGRADETVQVVGKKKIAFSDKLEILKTVQNLKYNPSEALPGD